MASLCAGLTRVREGKNNGLYVYIVYVWREGETKIVAKVFVGLTSAYAKKKSRREHCCSAREMQN